MNLFKVPVKVPKRNKFDLSHDLKSSGKMGRMIPVLALDVNPGEDFYIGIESLFRFLPMVAPVMHKVKVKTSFFFVPNRILCPTWEKFILGGIDGDDPVAVPTVRWQPVDQFAGFTIGGQMGLPGLPSGSNFIDVSAYPFAAYHRIYQDYYRPQFLEEEDSPDLLPGDNPWALDVAQSEPYSTNWALDYFTSALPYPQYGAEAVRIPVGGQNIILSDDASTQLLNTIPSGVANGNISSAGGVMLDGSGDPVQIDPNGTWQTDPNSAGTIDDLVRANALQNWLRRTARAGNRYVEQIRAIFGTPVQDARLQRPEFIGTVRQHVAFSEVLSTAETEAPIGQMAGHGISRSDSGRLHYKSKEHGWIIGILTVLPTAAYQDGVPRHWLRTDRFDYLFPDFANIGEQPVYNAEIFADLPDGVGSGEQRGTWGYQSRYCEMKQMQSRVGGLMRSELDFWHLGRKFQDLPALSRSFVQTFNDQATFGRIFADNAGEHFVFHMYFKISAIRPLPRFGIPSI